MEPQVLTDAGVSEREAEVLALLGEHRTNAEIAAHLYISVRTVESHVSSLLRKLAVSDRRALADLAGTVRVVDHEPEVSAVSPALPSPLTSFVGRVSERAELAAALTRHRLVTAVGPGGVGKTRLALAVAGDVTDRYAGGAWYVDLVPVNDGALVGAAVATALGFAEELCCSPTDTVTARLADVEALLVLDNCEHLVDGVVELVERLLSGCPRLVVLATSRARLVVPFEWVFAVPGLSRDGDDDGVGGRGSDGDGDAAALFVERAAMTGWSPSSAEDRRRVAAICDGLDGVALAIELAAARITTLGLDGLEAGLANQMGLLAGGSRRDERHRSVRSTLDWSYGLLDRDDQAVLRTTSVFASSFSLDAAVRLAGADGFRPPEVAEALARLADQSLLVVTVDPAGTRYRMLETIRQYGAERLDQTGEHDDVHARHLSWCLETAAALGSDRDLESGFDDVADDLRAALSWATAGSPDRRPEAHDLALRLAQLTFTRGMASETQSRYAQAAALTADDAEAAEALRMAANTALCRLAGDDALRLFSAAADAARRAGDDRAAAVDLTRAAEIMDRSPGILSRFPLPDEVAALLAEARSLAVDDPRVAAAIQTTESGMVLDPVKAERAVELAGQVGDPRLESAALDQLTVAQASEGRIVDAAASTRRRLVLLGPLPVDVEIAFELSDVLHMAALTSIGVGDLAAARRYAEQRRGLVFHRGEEHLLVNWLLVAAALAGDLAEAVAFGDRFRVGWERLGRLPLHGWATAPAAAAMAHGLRGDDDARSQWLAMFTAMLSVVAEPERVITGYGPMFEAIVALHRGQLDAAATEVAAAPESFNRWNTGMWRQWYAAVWAEVGVLAELPDRAERLVTARSIALGHPIATAIVDRSEALAGGDQGRFAEIAATFAAAGCPYQQARTLVLAGGDGRAEGEALLRAIGATPIRS